MFLHHIIFSEGLITYITDSSHLDVEMDHFFTGRAIYDTYSMYLHD
jgi:hypothetical protein